MLNEQTGKTFRRIATEEAFIIPEMIDGMRALIDSPGSSNLDVMTARELYSPDNKLGKQVMHKLLDFDDVRLAEMDANGVDMALLSLTSPGVQMFDADTAIEMAATANDRLAEAIARHPTRYAGLAAVAPQSPKRAALEMERSINSLHLNGFIINSHTNDEYLDHPKYAPILEAAESLDRYIYLHPRCPSDGMSAPFRDYHVFMKAAGWGFGVETATHVVKMIIGGVFQRHPKLKICLGHMGEGVHYWFSRLDHFTRVHQEWGHLPKTDLTPSETFKRNFVITTSGMEDHLALQFSIDRLGPDNVMWAIDFPYQASAPAVAFMDSAPIDDTIKSQIYASNAERLFHIRIPE